MYEKMAPTLHQQCQRLHMKTLQKLDIDQPERDQFEKVGTCQTQNLEIYCSVFSKISRFLERFPMEHIGSKNSSDFRVQIYLIYTIRINSKNLYIARNPLRLVFNLFILSFLIKVLESNHLERTKNEKSLWESGTA